MTIENGLEISINKHLRATYLDYFNNYITVDKFARDNHMSKDQANSLIHLGRTLHEEYVEKLMKYEQ